MLYEPHEGQFICPNCGTKFTEAATLEVGSKLNISHLSCPVCHFDLSEADTSEAALPQSSADLESQVHDLLLYARTSGVKPAEIVQVLRDELEFAVELDRTGRRFSVQIIDLGSDEQSWGTLPTPHNNRDLINSRSFDQ